MGIFGKLVSALRGKKEEKVEAPAVETPAPVVETPEPEPVTAAVVTKPVQPVVKPAAKPVAKPPKKPSTGVSKKGAAPKKSNTNKK